MFKKILFILFFILTTTALLQNCDTTEPPPNDVPDTTSQNFTFETHEFGDGFSSSYFNDVWIFDENNIWAVGEIRLRSGLTNIMRWDGSKWYPQKPWFTSSGFKGIWALDSANIFFASGAIRKYEEGEFIEFDLGYLGFSNGQAVHKLWGSSKSNIWGVGPSGTIVHYNGVEWKKIDFETEWFFHNIIGDQKSGVAYAVAYNSNFTSIIVELKTDTQQIIYSREDNTVEPRATGIISFDNNELFLSDSEIWKLDLKTRSYTIQKDLPSGYGLPTITGKAKNDLYYFGSKYNEGERMIHYNGSRYYEHVLIHNDFLLNRDSHAIKDLSVLVGKNNNKAFLTKIIRN